MGAIKNYLKTSVPEFQQEAPYLDGFLGAAGDLLDGTKESIEQFDYSHHYGKGTISEVEKSINDLGYRLPRGLPEGIKRQFLRDAHDIMIKNGTLDGLVLSLRLIGLNAEVNEGWLPYPEMMKKGMKKDPISGFVTRYDITRYLYTDLLYGEVYDTDKGTYLRGYTYQDVFKENPLEYIPIVGEQYDGEVITDTRFTETGITVAKTPYIIVRFSDGDFSLDTTQYETDNAGEYEFTLNERFQLINEIISYFIAVGNRPTTVRVIIIVASQPIDEALHVEDVIEDQHTYNPDGGDDLSDTVGSIEDTYEEEVTELDPNLYFDEELVEQEEFIQETTYEDDGGDSVGDGVVMNSELTQSLDVLVEPDIGTGVLIGGEQSPFISQFSAISIPLLGVVSSFMNEEEWVSSINVVKVYLGQTPRFPMRAGTRITGQATVSMNIFVGNVTKDGIYVETLFQSINSGSSFDFNHSNTHHYLRFEPVSGSNVGREIEITFEFFER